MKILVVDDNPQHLKASEELKAAGHEVETFSDYEPALERLVKGTDVEVLLADRNMLAEARSLGPSGLKYLGHPLDIGYILLIRAAQAGVKYEAVVTDASHHDDPGSAAVDWIERGMPITINAMKTLVIHAPLKKLNGYYAKDWAGVLNRLLAL